MQVGEYNTWVLANTESLSILENVLRTSLFLMPGRFRDSEVTLEFLYSIVGLLSLHHDNIVLEYLQKEKGNTLLSELDLPPKACFGVIKFLSLIRNCELFLEMASKHFFGNQVKWKTIFIIETLKGLLKLKLLWQMDGKMLMFQTVPVYRDHPILRNYLNAKLHRTKQSRTCRKVSQQKWKQFRQIRKAEDMGPSERQIIPELLHILRPIVYLLLMFRWGSKSWRAWITSFIMDTFSIHQHSQSTNLNRLQSEELTRRTALLFFYLLRSPMFDLLSRPLFQGISTKIKKTLPFVGTIFETLYENIVVYRKHYFYISGSD